MWDLACLLWECLFIFGAAVLFIYVVTSSLKNTQSNWCKFAKCQHQVTWPNPWIAVKIYQVIHLSKITYIKQMQHKFVHAERLSTNVIALSCFAIFQYCNGGYFSETSLRPRIPPARPRDPVIHIKPQAPKARGRLIRIQVLVSSQKQGTVPQHRATA